MRCKLSTATSFAAMIIAVAGFSLLAPTASAGSCGSRSGVSISVGFSNGYGSFRYGHSYHNRSYFSYRYPSYYHRRTYCAPYTYYRPTVVVRPYHTHRDYSDGLGYRHTRSTYEPISTQTVSFDDVYTAYERPAAQANRIEFTTTTTPITTASATHTVRATPRDTPTVSSGVTVVEAWDLLSEKQYDAAQLAFARLMTATPRDPSPKIGFGLASASLGQSARADRAFAHAALLNANIWDQLGHLTASRDTALDLLTDRDFRPTQATQLHLERLTLAAEPTDYTMPESVAAR